MPRVYHVKARKDYPNHGIKKGDMYYNWSVKTGPVSGITYRSLTPPRPEQLTTSAYLQSAYPIERSIHEISDIDALDAAISDVEGLRDEEEGKLDNMPDGLRDGDTGQLIQSRIDACEEAISALEEIKSEYESWQEEHEKPEDGESTDGEESDDSEEEEFDWSAVGDISLTDQ